MGVIWGYFRFCLYFIGLHRSYIGVYGLISGGFSILYGCIGVIWDYLRLYRGIWGDLGLFSIL